MAFQKTLQWIHHLASTDADPATHYDLRGAASLLRTHEGLPTINMGYWKNASTCTEEGLGDATRALFQMVGEAAGLNAGDGEVLDVGCGFGTNAIHCARQFGPRAMHGLNVSQVQLEWCRRLAAQEHLGTRLEFTHGSAVEMPFEDGRFDKLVSVEAAFHFCTRARFFREAHRVLKPGGVMALCDLVPLPPRNALEHLGLAVLGRALQSPRENVYGLDEYARHLCEAGFEIECLTSIVEHVRKPFRNWLFGQRWQRLFTQNIMFIITSSPFFLYPWDYVLVRVRKSG